MSFFTALKNAAFSPLERLRISRRLQKAAQDPFGAGTLVLLPGLVASVPFDPFFGAAPSASGGSVLLPAGSFGPLSAGAFAPEFVSLGAPVSGVMESFAI
jgi:hypothetical protein